jgi:hypothetical protein
VFRGARDRGLYVEAEASTSIPDPGREASTCIADGAGHIRTSITPWRATLAV